MNKKTFILSDQTQNHFGFVVLTAGIAMDRFAQNPTMLYNHIDGGKPEDVIGKWVNLRVENKQLLADEEIDREDDFGLRVAKKVDKGLIKGASIRLSFTSEDVSLDVDGYKGIPVVTKCELMEASIVTLPNNKNAVKLFCDDKEIEDTSIALSLSTNTIKPEIDKMKKIAVFAATLGLAFNESMTEDHVLEATKALTAERDALKLKIQEQETKLKAEADAKVAALIDGAIASKKLNVGQKDAYLKLASQDFENTKTIIDSLTAHTPISEQLNVGGGAEKKSPFEGKTYKELMAMPEGSKHLLKLRAGNVEEKAEHKKLWEAAYPGGTYNA